MKLIYVAREKPTAGRAPTLQILHTLRGLCLAGASVRFVTPWPVRSVRRRCMELTGHPVPEDLEIVSLGPGPDVPVLSRVWPGPVWRGIRARIHRYLWEVRRREPHAVVYTRNLRLVAEIPADDIPPVIFESHEPRSRVRAESQGHSDQHPEVERLREQERRALAGSVAVVTVTQGQANEIRQQYSHVGPLWVIPNGADPDIFGVSPEERNPCPGRLLYVGALAPWKGLDLALQALRSVPHAELHICGGQAGTNDWKGLVQLARELGVLDRLRLHGTVPQPKLRPLLASAVAGVLPLNGDYSIASRYTSPLKLFEYLCAGLPVIATDLPSIQEVVTHGKHAILFADRSADDLARAMCQILSDTSLAARLAMQAHLHSANYTWKRRGERIIEACRSVLRSALAA
jgi:glycosyltransferase involved in cell wall biosynthesis